MTRIAVICARGGSKGVPGKNVRSIAGRPLIAWTVLQAHQSGVFDAVAVSSDSAEILDAAATAGPIVRVTRPADLATDTASVHPAVVHCLDRTEAHLGAQAESFVLLQATSPLRTSEDIRGAVALWENYRPGSVVSARPAHSSPYFTLLEEAEDGSVRLSKPSDPPLVRRQDAPRCWDLNGAIYVFDRARYAVEPRVLYLDTRVYQMPEERSFDIDTPLDFDITAFLMERRSSGQ